MRNRPPGSSPRYKYKGILFSKVERITMYVKEVTVENQAVCNARPATFFIQKANE